MTTTLRFTSADLDAFPDDGKRYEIIDGDLYVSRAPGWEHQYVCGEVYSVMVLAATVLADDASESPLLPGLSVSPGDLLPRSAHP